MTSGGVAGLVAVVVLDAVGVDVPGVVVLVDVHAVSSIINSYTITANTPDNRLVNFKFFIV